MSYCHVSSSWLFIDFYDWGWPENKVLIFFFGQEVLNSTWILEVKEKVQVTYIGFDFIK